MLAFYFNTKGSVVEHNCPAPVFAVRAFERGFFPIYTPATAEQLNHEIPDNVLEAALVGSMFGWNVPGAADAAKFCEAKEKEQAIS